MLVSDYKDVGCKYHDLCATCPFSQCLKDFHGGLRGAVASVRRHAMLTEAALFNKPTTTLAEEYGMHDRSVRKALSRARMEVAIWER